MLRDTENKVRSSPQRVSIFQSPLLPRASRSNNKSSSNGSANLGQSLANEAGPAPPPVAPRRRSRTPEAHSHDRIGHAPLHLQQNHQSHQQPNNKSPKCYAVPNKTHSGNADPGYCRPQVPASPNLNRAVSTSPARSIPPASPGPSRALSASPLPRTGSSLPPHTYPSNSSLSQYPGQLPHHQYGVPGISQSYAPFNYSPKPYSQAYNQYCNPYSQVLPSKSQSVPYASISSCNHARESGTGLSSNHSGLGGTSIGGSSSSGVLAGGGRHPSGGGGGTLTAVSTCTSSSSSSSSSASHTPPLLRKTPEPVR